jgi:hypothetical protein
MLLQHRHRFWVARRLDHDRTFVADYRAGNFRFYIAGPFAPP